MEFHESSGQVHIPLNDDCRTEDGKKKIDCEYGYKQGLRASRRRSHEMEYEPVLQTSLILTEVSTERRVRSARERSEANTRASAGAEQYDIWA